MNRSPNFVVAADDGIDLALTCTSSQVDAVLLQRLERALWVLARHARRPTNLLQSLQECGTRRARRGEQVAYSGATFLGEADQQVLRADVLVAALCRQTLCRVQHLQGRLIQRRLRDGTALSGRQCLDGVSCITGQRSRVCPHCFQQRSRDSRPHLQERVEQMNRFDLRVAVTSRDAHGGAERVLGFRGELNVHGRVLSVVRVAQSD